MINCPELNIDGKLEWPTDTVHIPINYMRLILPNKDKMPGLLKNDPEFVGILVATINRLKVEAALVRADMRDNRLLMGHATHTMEW